jgi:general stress protein 26
MAKKDTPAGSAKANGSVKKLRKLMKDIRIAMLTTVARDGSLHSRPMMTSDVEFDGNLWFIASGRSALAEEITGNPNVNAAYANAKGSRYISVSGKGSFVRDEDKLKALWTGKHKAWFPEGKKNSDLTLLRIEVQFAEYWDATADSVQLSQFVRPESEPALATGGDDSTGAGAQG